MHELVTKDSLQSCLDFLEKRKESCLFPLGNLADHGFQLGKHINSGNYRLLKRNREIAGVFVLSRRGNLLIQTNGKDDYSHEIYEAIQTENINLKGIIGPWKDCFLFKSYYEAAVNAWKACSISKQRLYRLSLNNKNKQNLELEPGLSIRFLKEKDFDQWKAMNLEYMKEAKLPIEGDSEKRKQIYKGFGKNKNQWGVFQDKKLISIGAYNTKYKDIGQIGGVFTTPEKRGKGYSKLCMKQLISDSKTVHQLDRLILFTGENNIAAQNLYESLGFKRIGDFGLIFGSYLRGP